MCTVTYIPQGKDHFILTSNRDEQAVRSPGHLTLTQIGGLQLAFPRDTEAGGTWIAVSGDHRVVCLLNGAFEKHERRGPYKRSRGLMVLDFFQYDRSASFFRDFDFQGMEPFTMVIYDRGKLYDFRWDGHRTHLLPLATDGYYIWSSATLYDEVHRSKREGWFANWLRTDPHPGRQSVMGFHTTAGEGDPYNDVIMNRNGVVQTVSITSIEKDARQVDLEYHDLLRNAVKKAKIQLQGEVVEPA